MTVVLCQFGRRLAAEIGERCPTVEVRAIGTGDALEDDAAGEVLVTSHHFAKDLPVLAERGVRWIHNFGTGVDGFPFDQLTDGQVLTCSRGAGAEPISEWVITQLLAFEKRLPQSWITEPPEHWNQADLGSLAGSHVGIIGLGGIGEAVARRVLPFGAEVQAYRRRPLPAADPGVEVVTDLLAMAEWADHLVVTAPATPETHHLVGPALFEVLGPGAHVVNIARGSPHRPGRAPGRSRRRPGRARLAGHGRPRTAARGPLALRPPAGPPQPPHLVELARGLRPHPGDLLRGAGPLGGGRTAPERRRRGSRVLTYPSESGRSER